MKMKIKYLLIACLFPLICQGQNVKGFIQRTDKIDVNLSDGLLSIYPLTENAVRIKFYKNDEMQVPELIFTSNIPLPRFQVFDSLSKLELKGEKIIVVVDKQTGKLSFA